VQLTNVPAKFNWCAYVSDYPPNVTANNGTYTFKGTPPFTLIASNGATQIVTGKTLTTSALTITPTTIRDKTECPGIFCPYQGSDLLIDATHLCQQRTSGAKNWEAYIQDSRDNIIYYITQWSDGSWWFTEDLATTLKRKATCGGLSWYAAQDKPACPAGWNIPTFAKFSSRWPTATEGTDTYGGALNSTNLHVGYSCAGYRNCASNNSSTAHYVVDGFNNCIQWDTILDIYYCYCDMSGVPNNCTITNTYPTIYGRVRCFRQL
jgi:hypothetical protein